MVTNEVEREEALGEELKSPENKGPETRDQS